MALPDTHSKSGRAVLLGSQACGRGAYEAGVRLAIGYPGTPATPAIEYLIGLKGGDLRAEWAINEKVSIEIAVGVSWAGQRAFSAVKMSGLNVAADSLLSLATSGVRGGLVIMVGDDPGAYYGMVEQDSRLMARLAMVPMIEPATPEEARWMTRDAFEVSERVQAPVLIRQTTTTALHYGEVNLENPLRSTTRSSLPNDLSRFTKAGASSCIKQHADTLERLARAGAEFDYLNVLTDGECGLGVIAAASVSPYVEECLADSGRQLPHYLKIAVLNPLPDDKIRMMISRCDRILVVEELEPLIEERVRALAHDMNKFVGILGKNVLPQVGDLDPDLVDGALKRLKGETPDPIPPGKDLSAYRKRKSVFCPGCPHRSTYSALSKGIRLAGYIPEEVMVTGDVGCTILGMEEPFDLCRTELVMGASIAMAQGFFYAGLNTPVIATIGDSTFYHSGITALLNAASRDVDLTVIVLDNDYAAMTGFQPTVATTADTSDATPVRMRLMELVRAARVRRVRSATPYFTKRLAGMIARAIRSKGVNVIISEAPCSARRKFRALIPCAVKESRCKGWKECGYLCLKETGCPAITHDREKDRAAINKLRCIGCGLCVDTCPSKAIKKSVGLLRRF